MIKVNSKVIIKELNVAREEWLAKERPPAMVVEGLYYQSTAGLIPSHEMPEDNDYEPVAVKCLWYNTRNELQSAFINLELLTEL